MPYKIVKDHWDQEFQVPAKWAICDRCEGSGGSSAWLGAFSAEEFAEQFDYDEQADYFAGKYDRPCEFCGGSGKVLIANVAAASFAAKRAMVCERQRARWDAEARAEQRRESMMLGEY